MSKKLKTIAIPDGTFELYVSEKEDEFGCIMEITPLDTLNLFREKVPELMDMINKMTTPTVSFDYYLPDDINRADALRKEYERKFENHRQTFARYVKPFLSAFYLADANYFITGWGGTSLSCMDIAGRVMNRYKELTNEFSKAITGVGNYMENLTRDINQTIDSAVLIAAPTLSAVLSNEATSARFHAKSNSSQQRYLLGVSRAIDIIIAYQKALKSELPKILEKGLKDIEDVFLCEKIRLSGSAAEKMWWKNLKEHPLDIGSYISIFENESDVYGLDELIDLLRIDRDDLFGQCIIKLQNKMKTGSISDILIANRRFIDNTHKYFDIEENELVKAVFVKYVSNIQHQMLNCCMCLPKDALEGIKGQKDIPTCAEESVQTIITKKDYLYICENIDNELHSVIARRLGMDVSQSAMNSYEAVVASVQNRMVQARELLDKMEAEVKILSKKKEAYQEELKSAGLFAFSKKRVLKEQIEETEKRRAEVYSTYNKKIEAL